MNALATRIQDLAEKRRQLFADLPAANCGRAWCRQHSDLADEAIRLVFECASTFLKDSPPIAVIAVGGFGRCELAPYSDLDIAVVPLDESHPATDGLVKRLYYDLNAAFDSSFKAELGYAFHLVNDAPALDAKSRTGMMDARLVAGSDEAFDIFMRLFKESFPTGDFLIDKIRERRENFARYHDTPLVVEPQLKEGAGGLRSRHAANWIRKAIGADAIEYSEPFDQILKNRNLLHFVAGKRVDHLSRQRQEQVADAAGLDLQEWLSHSASHMEQLHQEYEAAERMLVTETYSISESTKVERGAIRVAVGAEFGSAAMGIAIGTGLGLNATPQEFHSDERVDGGSVLHAISQGEAALRSMDRSGLLAIILPELQRCRTLMPEDATHTYTVYEHSLRAIRNLDRFIPGTFLGELKQSTSNLGSLYLALLLHDLGKGLDERPHSESGAELAEGVCKRWQLGETGRLVSWLVQEHLTLARYVRMRDIQNPQTASDLAADVGTQERLDLLTLLTAADIQAVSDTAWTPALEHLMQDLWQRTAAMIGTEDSPGADPAVSRKRLQKALGQTDVAEAELAPFLQSLPAHYLISTPPDRVRAHFSFAAKAAKGDPTIEIDQQPNLGTTELTVCCEDSPGLLSRLLGVLYAWDLSLHSIRASTTSGDGHIAIDSFTVSFGEKAVPASTCQHAAADLMRVIKNELTLESLLTKHGKDPTRRQERFTFNFLPGSPAILEIRAPRGRGMAYRMSRLIAEQGWEIVSARIGQWAGQGAAAFYITNCDGRPLSKEEIDLAIHPQQ